MSVDSPNLGGLDAWAFESRRVDKPWGHELIWAHAEDYVGKVLFVKAGESLSLQFHREKDESWLIQAGRAKVELAVAPGEDDDVGVAEAADLAADLEAVERRQHQVEQHQVRPPLRRHRQGLGAVAGRADREAVALQVAPDHLADHRFVVDDQHLVAFHPADLRELRSHLCHQVWQRELTRVLRR